MSEISKNNHGARQGAIQIQLYLAEKPPAEAAQKPVALYVNVACDNEQVVLAPLRIAPVPVRTD